MDLRELSRMNSSHSHGLIVGPPNPFPFGVPAVTAPPPGSNSLMPQISAGMIHGMTSAEMIHGMTSDAMIHDMTGMYLDTTSMPILDATGSLYQEDDMSGIREQEPALFNMGEQVKKRRGRPRKYGPDGSMSLDLSPALTHLPTNPAYSNDPMSNPAAKRRGRPQGSRKKQQLESLGSGSVGTAFSAHVINVKIGEDVSSKILAFSQQSPSAVCILSANGVISNVTLRQPLSPGGTVTYEGRYEIISLSGSLMPTEEDVGTRCTMGGMSVTLAGADGKIIGGSVDGMLQAASAVQVVLGSFIAEGEKPKTGEASAQEPSSAAANYQMPGFTAAPSNYQMPGFTAAASNYQMPGFTAEMPGFTAAASNYQTPGFAAAASNYQTPGFAAAAVAGGQLSEGTSNESSDDPGSPLIQIGSRNISGEFIQPMYPSFSWGHPDDQE